MIIGTCSLCGGPVVIPDTWYGVCRPIPSCERCGAIPKTTFGSVIEMTPVNVTVSTSTGRAGE